MMVRLIALVVTLAALVGAISFFEPAALGQARAWLERRWRVYIGVT